MVVVIVVIVAVGIVVVNWMIQKGTRMCGWRSVDEELDEDERERERELEREGVMHLPASKEERGVIVYDIRS